MALPLRAGERVIGALDVQSAQMAAFDESDVAVLQGMADQVAVALENARLFQQTQAALKEIEATNRLLVREGWQGYLEQKTTRRAEFLTASGPVQDPLPGKAAPQTEPLTVPLELRGQSLGRLTLRRESSRAWSEDETRLIQTIAVQTVLAAENARLIEETQRTLGETRALYETSREITSAGEMSEVLAAVLNNLAHTGVHAAAVALFDAPTREQAKNIELVGTWDYVGTPRLAPGVRFEIANFPMFNRITREKAMVSQDLPSDPEIDDMAKAVLGGLGFRAMTVTPLVARGQWIGVLFAMMETPHTFTPSELNFHRALADQTAVAIDSRRLLTETQHRAEREQLIRQITTRIRAAGDIQGVLETTANELARSMGVSRSIVRLTMGNE
jgi:GAF domain-containing protein